MAMYHSYIKRILLDNPIEEAVVCAATITSMLRWPPMGYLNGQDHNIPSLVHLIQFHWMAV